MHRYLALVLHAHLPFVRHPEHKRFLEESWLFEAILETYVPLLQLLGQWQREQLNPHLTLCLSPTLCAMLRDPLLQERFKQRLAILIDLAEQEIRRTLWLPEFHVLAEMYYQRFQAIQAAYEFWNGDLVGAFRHYQDAGWLEIITTAATHALLPLLADHPPSLRAQVRVACDSYRDCFGAEPRGIWLPECAYSEAIETALLEANLRWFIVDTHGLVNARPQVRYQVFAPVYTPNGLAVFGRDLDSAQQVWSRQGGYPGDARYRDFYRDIGFDLDFDYMQHGLPSPAHHGFTGLKYFAISSGADEKNIYDRHAAHAAVVAHAAHFVAARQQHLDRLAGLMDCPPLLVAPYDAELFGHWWYEGLDFLDQVVRSAPSAASFQWTNLSEFLTQYPTHQVATPSPSSWGEEGYWRVWLEESNAWIYPQLNLAQKRMTALVRQYPQASGLVARALRLAGNELLLAQGSDWPFILRTNTDPSYARQRVQNHLDRFHQLDHLITRGQPDENYLREVESWDSAFPYLDWNYWA